MVDAQKDYAFKVPSWCNNKFDVTLLIWDNWDQLGTNCRFPKKLCLQTTFMMQLTPLSSLLQANYVVLRPIIDKFKVILLIWDKWDQLGTNCKCPNRNAFKEPSGCSWRHFPAHLKHIMWFSGLSKTNLRSYCSFETSETSWAQIEDAQISYAFKEPSWCSWRPFPANPIHIMWFRDL